MIIQKLKDKFINSLSGEKAISFLNLNSKNELFLQGLTDSAKGFFLASVIDSGTIKNPILYLANDSSSAINIYYELFNLTSMPVYYFCGHEVSPYDQILSDPEVISHQSKTLLHLIQKKNPCIIISTAKYLSEKVWNKEELTNNCFIITKDLTIDPKELREKLVASGYKNTTVVTSKGEFSSRGDIFDIFPVVGSPARISFIGDEIESIRSYSVTTQRSVDILDKVLISPRYYVISPDITKLKEELLKISRFNLDFADLINQKIEQFFINNYEEGIEYYAQYFNQKESSLFDYLPLETSIIIDDWELNSSSLETWEKRNLEIKNDLEKNKNIVPLKKSLIFEKDLILQKIKSYTRAYIERFEPFEDSSRMIDMKLLPQERFNNQLEVFIERIKQWTREGNKVVIFSDQPQRVNGLLKEWEISSKFGENLREDEYDLNNIFINTGGVINGFKIPEGKIIVLTDQEIFGIKRKTHLIHQKTELKQAKHQYYTNIEDIKINDYVVHIKHGIGKYRGLVKITVDNNEREYLMVEYASEGKLYLPVEQINLLYRYRGANEVVPKLSRLGGSDWELTKKKVKKAIKKVAEDLLNLYTARSKLEGFSFGKDVHWQIEMEEAFPYTETPDQWKAINDVKKDMESSKPMDRLVCGDVGYGKTEVAIRAMFKAVLSGKQVCVLVPTTILAQQHFNVISERLAAYPVRVALLSRFKTNKEQKITVGKLALGEVDIVIGTHRLLQRDVQFKDLGLVVIDEEQRFGVLHKEKLKQLRVTVDVLTLSATPIPRTLYMALSGARDLSLINTAPSNRLPIKTFVGECKSTIIKNAILHELERGGQIYFVHNRIETIDKTAAYLQELVPEAQIIIAHGRMNEKDLENVMYNFSLKKYNVLVCTTIIESGLDIPNVNTIIVDNADHFGLAQLYQLRGRVGRTDIQAFAYCLYAPEKVLTEIAKNRLEAIKEFTSLGSGYQIALRDMEIRGIGNILGAEQHGHMISVGFDLYCQLLNEAVDKLRGIQTQDPELECEVDINVSAFIPSFYIQDENQKVVEYKRLANVKSKRELEYIEAEWKDRFGKYPEEVENLLKILEIRLLASSAGITMIKSEQGTELKNVKIEVNFRLQHWFKIQKMLSKKLVDRTSLKALARGSSTTSYILLRTIGLNVKEQLNLIYELIVSLRELNVDEKIA